MTAKILVVDDIETNVRLLEAKLTAEYYDVVTARDGPAGIEAAVRHHPDVILLDVMMPGMDGFEVCRVLKTYDGTRHIPIVLVTALDGRQDRINGLRAGADEFLTKPIDDILLMARLKSLTRLKLVTDELRHREASARKVGVIDTTPERLTGSGGRIIVLDDNARQASRMVDELAIDHRPIWEQDPEAALLSAHGPVDLMIINTLAREFDGLRVAAHLRSEEATRAIQILAVVDPEDRPRLIKALDIGVNDVLTRPIDPQELAARVGAQIRQKRYADRLRSSLDQSLELAVTDPLTGLNNRRFMQSQLAALLKRAARGGDPVSVLLVDIDHFKRINDSFGHDVGDEVLREFALRLATNVRAIDLPCRFGGEEFVVVMPGASTDDARRIAERLRLHVAGSPFMVSSGDHLSVTISVGVATSDQRGDTPDRLVKRADEAVYQAKTNGRNQVIVRAA